jgi:CHAT domain-containing protein
MRLSAELVVLSACRTGLGKDVRGEGLLGLTRGFMHAGAPRVLASLWKVSDTATAALMARFYRELLESGLAPPKALRQAQLMLRKERRTSAPHAWAGFVLEGDWQPFREGSTASVR